MSFEERGAKVTTPFPPKQTASLITDFKNPERVEGSSFKDKRNVVKGRRAGLS